MRWDHSTPEERAAATLDSHTIRDANCLRFTGQHTNGGYGRFRFRNRSTVAHRIAWELAYGPIEDGHEIDHVYRRGCRHRDCVNIWHLESVPGPENRRRATRQSKVGWCESGRHPQSDPGECLPCRQERSTAYYAANRETILTKKRESYRRKVQA